MHIEGRLSSHRGLRLRIEPTESHGCERAHSENRYSSYSCFHFSRRDVCQRSYFRMYSFDHGPSECESCFAFLIPQGDCKDDSSSCTWLSYCIIRMAFGVACSSKADFTATQYPNVSLFRFPPLNTVMLLNKGWTLLIKALTSLPIAGEDLYSKGSNFFFSRNRRLVRYSKVDL